MARVMGKTFRSAWIVTTLTGVTFDQVFAYLFYNLVYLAIFQLLRVQQVFIEKGPRTARRASTGRGRIPSLRGRPQEHVLLSAVYCPLCCYVLLHFLLLLLRL
jgi:hypothetical protein